MMVFLLLHFVRKQQSWPRHYDSFNEACIKDIECEEKFHFLLSAINHFWLCNFVAKVPIG